MEIKKITQKDVWEEFFLNQKEKTFLQSWNWGEFQKKTGNKIWRLGLFEKGKLIVVVLVAKIIAKRGTFLLIQHGPVVKNLESEAQKSDQRLNYKLKVLKTLLEEFKKIGKGERADFIRIASLWKEDEENQKIFQQLGFRESPLHANAYEATWKLDLSPLEQDLLSKMRKTTRYLIRQTLKNQEIKIETSEKFEDIELYQKLNKEVSKRQKFVAFSFEYIKNEFEVFAKDNQVLLFFGKYKGEIVAAGLIIFWSGICFYHQAASSEKYAKLSIPYLLLWEAIKEAKKRGCRLFDFWGYVDPKTQPKHPWTGPTLFKMGFGGKSYQYVKTQDFPLSKNYWLTFLFEKLRKIKRNL